MKVVGVRENSNRWREMKVKHEEFIINQKYDICVLLYYRV